MSALSSLLEPAGAPTGPRAPPPPRANLYHFDAIIDVLLVEPGITMQELAKRIQRGAVWVSMVIKSDAFAEHYAKRRAVLNETLLDAVRSKLADVAVEAAGQLSKTLKENPYSLSADQKLSILDKTTGRLGFGQPQQAPTVGVNVSVPQAGAAVFVASAEQIARARERYRATQATAAPVESDRPQGGASAAPSVALEAPVRHADVVDVEPLHGSAPDEAFADFAGVGADA